MSQQIRRRRLQNRFNYEAVPIVYVVSKEGDKPHLDTAGFLCRYLKYRDLNKEKNEILRIIKEEPCDCVFTDSTDPAFVRTLGEFGIPVYIRKTVPGINAFVTEEFGEIMYSFGGYRKSQANEELKRFFDICGSIIGLFLCSLVYIIFGPIIKLTSPGPVIYASTRLGYNGRPFTIYKFRTMRDRAEKERQDLSEKNEMDGRMFKIKDDPRITAVGKFMRKTSLDEFPQFYNVLRGEMSIVGTRPPLQDEVVNYEYRHKRRLCTKPGITGVWQVSGRNDVTDFDKIVKMDTWYVRHDSIFVYFWIIFRTIICIFEKGGR